MWLVSLSTSRLRADANQTGEGAGPGSPTEPTLCAEDPAAPRKEEISGQPSLRKETTLVLRAPVSLKRDSLLFRGNPQPEREERTHPQITEATNKYQNSAVHAFVSWGLQ